jgi:hypothetical protein
MREVSRLRRVPRRARDVGVEREDAGGVVTTEERWEEERKAGTHRIRVPTGAEVANRYLQELVRGEEVDWAAYLDKKLNRT